MTQPATDTVLIVGLSRRNSATIHAVRSRRVRDKIGAARDHQSDKHAVCGMNCPEVEPFVPAVEAFKINERAKCSKCLAALTQSGMLSLLLLITGCGLPSADVSPVKPAPESDTVWSVVAEYIDSGRIDNTDTLILVVDRLRETDAITDNDRATFFAAFKGIKEKRRDATSEDANTLRQLK